MENNREIGNRLRLTFEALGLIQIEFARRADIKPQALNNNIQGLSRIGIDNALKLCQTYGLTLDWIYNGYLGHLPQDLASKIIKLQQTRRPPKRG